MIGTIALSMLVIGCALAISSDIYPASAELMEYAAGVLIVGGLLLLGAGIEWALRPLPLRFG